MSKERICDKCKSKILKDQVYFRLIRVELPTKGKYGLERKTSNSADLCLLCYNTIIGDKNV